MSEELEKYVRNNPDALDRKQPDPAVLNRVLEAMKAPRSDEPRGRVISIRVWKWAAACLLVAACGIALWYFNRQEPATEVVQNNTPEQPPLPSPKADALPKAATLEPGPARQQPAAITGEPATTLPKKPVRKVKTGKTMVMAGLHNMQSAASRINAIASVSGMKNNHHVISDALMQTLNNDPNANVRLAALDGLTRFHKETRVREKLAASLKQQQDPLVQISLIGLLTRMRESSILPDLEDLVNNENTMQAVKRYGLYLDTKTSFNPIQLNAIVYAKMFVYCSVQHCLLGIGMRPGLQAQKNNRQNNIEPSRRIDRRAQWQ